MPKKTKFAKSAKTQQPQGHGQGKDFHIEFMNSSQKIAWAALQKHDITFLVGPAGSAKTYLATAFAIQKFLAKEIDTIILTRPVVEAGEKLGYLPGTFQEKLDPYMMPLYDAMDKLLGKQNPLREKIQASVKTLPLAFMRGCTFDNAIAILDEAQNTTPVQMKLFLTRLGKNSKIIVTGDPYQTDLYGNNCLPYYVNKLREIPGIGMVEFKETAIVRHPLISKILGCLDEKKSILDEDYDDDEFIPQPSMVEVYKKLS